MNKKINFEVNDFQIVENESNSQFATFECDICRSGNNTHRLVISKEAIRNSAHSAKGKPILASFRWDKQDFRGHESDETPIGFTADDLEPEIVDKDGEDYIRVKGKIWKRYFQDAMDILERKEGKTEVSMEMVVLKGVEPTIDADGAVDLFSIQAITVLGVPPSIKGSELRVLSFSEMMDEYHKESQSDLEQFSDSRKEVMSKSYKVNKTELKDTPWGDVDKTALRNKIMSATNRSSLVKSVYALVEGGWQTAPSEHLKYPLMQFVGSTLYYNKGALASALAYAKQENEQSVINKVESLYRKFKLNMEDEMAEEKKKELTAEIIEAEEKFEEEVKPEEDKEEMAETPTEEKEETEDAPEEPEKEKMEEEPSEEEEEDKGEDEEAEDFAEEVVPFAKALMQLMDCANADERMACRVTMSYGEDENIVMDRVCAGCDEMAELRAFKEQCLAEKTEFGVAEVLASVKQSLSQEDFAELEEKSKDVKFETLETFKMQAKAFAFEHMDAKVKEAQEDEVIRMGVDTIEEKPKNVFERILGK